MRQLASMDSHTLAEATDGHDDNDRMKVNNGKREHNETGKTMPFIFKYPTVQKILFWVGSLLFTQEKKL